MQNIEMTHKYIPRIHQREENLFLEEYYSGTDTKVYLNTTNDENKLEISYISFSVNEQLKPIYGYASRTFDDMAVGSRIVTGIFKVPIKNPEKQDSYETVVLGNSSVSTLEEIEENNRKEKEVRDKTEWANDEIKESNVFTTEEILFYQTILNNMGYNASDSGYLDNQTVDAIKKFQNDYSLFSTGNLNSETMIEIENQMYLSTKPIKSVSGITYVRFGPFEDSDVIYILQQNEKFIELDIVGEYSYIRTNNGECGYIFTSSITEE